MEQLIAHLFGDYILQSDWMALNKRNSWRIAGWHAWTYSLPFLFFKPSVPAYLAIFLSHWIIDRLGLARYVVWAKNWLGEKYKPWADCSATGYDKERPAWLTVWLLIAADNTIHLLCNYLALRFL